MLYKLSLDTNNKHTNRCIRIYYNLACEYCHTRDVGLYNIMPRSMKLRCVTKTRPIHCYGEFVAVN